MGKRAFKALGTGWLKGGWGAQILDLSHHAVKSTAVESIP